MRRRTAVIAGLLVSAALAGTTRASWTRASATDLAGTAREVVVTGSDAAPTVLALAIVGLAAALATSLSSAVIRLITGPVMILAGLGAAAGAVTVTTDPLAASRGAVAEAVGVMGGEASAQATVWPLVSLLPAAGLAAIGVLVLVRGGRWSSGTRYRRTAPAARAVDPEDDPAGAWDALSAGEDPSAQDEARP